MDTGRIAVDGGELYYESVGTGPAVVLAHGGVLDLRMWDRDVDVLADRYRVVRYDARSHGRSSTATGDHRRDDDLVAVLDALGIARAAVVGLSMGARTGIDLAVSAPDRLWALCATSPGISGMEFTDPFVIELWAVAQEAIEGGDVAGFVEAFLHMWADGPHRAPTDVNPDVRELCRRLATETASRHADESGAVLERDAWHHLAEIRVPTLAILGTVDASDIHRAVAALATQVPGARRLDLPDVAHMVNLEAESAFHEAVTEFLDSIQSTEDQ